MSAKKKYKIIKLVSSFTKHFYIIKKSKKLKLKSIELKKFDPIIRKHVLYKELIKKK